MEPYNIFGNLEKCTNMYIKRPFFPKNGYFFQKIFGNFNMQMICKYGSINLEANIYGKGTNQRYG